MPWEPSVQGKKDLDRNFFSYSIDVLFSMFWLYIEVGGTNILSRPMVQIIHLFRWSHCYAINIWLYNKHHLRLTVSMLQFSSSYWFKHFCTKHKYFWALATYESCIVLLKFPAWKENILNAKYHAKCSWIYVWVHHVFCDTDHGFRWCSLFKML